MTMTSTRKGKKRHRPDRPSSSWSSSSSVRSLAKKPNTTTRSQAPFEANNDPKHCFDSCYSVSPEFWTDLALVSTTTPGDFGIPNRAFAAESRRCLELDHPNLERQSLSRLALARRQRRQESTVRSGATISAGAHAAGETQTNLDSRFEFREESPAKRPKGFGG
jgi:hypothetical protein